MAFGRPRRSSLASALNSQAQFMLDLGPRLRFPLARLLETAPEPFCLNWGNNVIGIDQFFRLDDDRTPLLRDRQEIPLPYVEVVEDLSRDHHLATLADPSD